MTKVRWAVWFLGAIAARWRRFIADDGTREAETGAIDAKGEVDMITTRQLNRDDMKGPGVYRQLNLGNAPAGHPASSRPPCRWLRCLCSVSKHLKPLEPLSNYVGNLFAIHASLTSPASASRLPLNAPSVGPGKPMRPVRPWHAHRNAYRGP